MFNDVLFLLVLLGFAVVVLLYPVGVALATARAAERVVKRRGGGRIDHLVAAVTTIAAVIAGFIAQPLVAFVASIPVLVLLAVLERRARWRATEREMAIAVAVARRAS